MSNYILNPSQTTVSVKLAKLSEITFYEIHMKVWQDRYWTVKRRYSEFDKLNDELIKEIPAISKDLLPGKKLIGKNSSAFLEQRRKGLETYLIQILQHLHRTPLPLLLVEFLSFDKYDVNFAVQKMALEFSRGENAELNWTFTIFDMFCITSRIRQPKNNFELADSSFDFSHILDFCKQLKTLRIVPTKEQNSETKEDYIQQLINPLGTSNILPSTLTFDLSAFSPENLELIGIVPQNIVECENVKSTVKNLTVNFTRVQNIQQILSPDSIHEKTDGAVWKNVEMANFAFNDIWTIDASIKQIGNVKQLHLNDNRIKKIANLKSLHNLNHLDLSMNIIDSVDMWHYELGNIETLQLSNNKLKVLQGLSKLRSLVVLDLSFNEIDDIGEIDEINQLPLIENLNLNGNPLAVIVDYRSKVMSRFSERCNEIILDNEKCSQEELDKALVLNALRKTKIST